MGRPKKTLNDSIDELIEFIETEQFWATATDGWSYYVRAKVIESKDVIKKLNNIKKRIEKEEQNG